MRILGIESSCDETAIAIVEDGSKILSNVVVSQIDIFAAYGGVIPEIAARSHLEAIMPVLHQAFKEAGFTKETTLTAPTINNSSSSTQTSVESKVSSSSASTSIESKVSSSPASASIESKASAPTIDDWSKIDAIAVTHTPGLLGSLLVGTLTARTLAILHQKPLYAVHHLKSHIYANWLDLQQTAQETQVSTPEFPLISLIISGGHTQIVTMPTHQKFEIIGTTRDDAVGECFDKVAKILGLPYPGGPSIAKAAENGNNKRYSFPHPMTGSLDFSFSGLKTAVLREVQKAVNQPISFPSTKLAPLLSDQQKADFAASFEQTATDILIEKIKLALKQNPETKSLVVAGGVSANQRLRHNLKLFIEQQNAKLNNKIKLFFPEPHFSGDNGAMVASAAYYEILSGYPETDPYTLNIMPRSKIK